MKYIRICGDCRQVLHKKKVKGLKWGGPSLGYFTWLHLNNGQYTTCLKDKEVITL